ncbi:MAG: glutamine-hydrolyzing carbamoyl-phosphate synthase small subunit [Brevinematales bacterium]|nr:glutamine-hydrolyzing carbamoyl-phosphate synthase small subunit [Brevinematales bacterium]
MDFKKNAVLVLKDGTVFYGRFVGYVGTTWGEVVFNTGMTGYQEILTDPSYHKQIVVMTYPHIGNYGVNDEDVESDTPKVAGFVMREISEYPSNSEAKKSLRDYLIEHKVVAIDRVDTRKLTRHIRNHGAMMAIISDKIDQIDKLKEEVKKLPDMVGLDLTIHVSTKQQKTLIELPSYDYNIVALDYGMKWNIARLFAERKAKVTFLPYTVSAKDVLSLKPDGIFVSNGPGDPAAITHAIKLIKELIGKKPMFGICLGHQLISLALGAKTYKLKFGHHAINHPVKNLKTGKVEITSQNHGFAVDPNTLPKNVEVSHINLNDHSVEGILCESQNLMAVQYHPEAGPGPHDSRYLFDEFLSMIQ